MDPRTLYLRMEKLQRQFESPTENIEQSLETLTNALLSVQDEFRNASGFTAIDPDYRTARLI